MPPADTHHQILDAVLAVVGESGLAGLGVEAVAERAGVSRQTVYRHFANRHRLIEEAILREEETFIRRMKQAAAEQDGLGPTVRAAVATALSMAREHPVLSRLVEQEPETLLPYLLLGRGPVVSAAEPAVEDLLRDHCPDLPPDRLSLVADMATRLLVSYVVSPAAVDDGALADEVARLVVSLVDAEVSAA